MGQFDNTLYIIGSASTAIEIREAVELASHNFSNILNVVENGGSCRYSYIEDKYLEDHVKTSSRRSYILGFTELKLRVKYRNYLESLGVLPVNVIHPRALISKSAKIGLGNYFAANSVVSAESIIGNQNIINIGVSIGHNSIIGDDNVFNPGAKISGNVNIGNRCLFGANSFVFQGILICSDCKIDALTYLNQNLEGPSICTSNTGFKKYKNRI